MYLKNIKIRTQLLVGFGTLLAFVIGLGVVSFIQSRKLYKQTETLYSHPLQVQIAIGDIRADILTIRSDMKDLVFTGNEKQATYDVNRIELLKEDSFVKLDSLYKLFLGPRADLDELKKELLIWNSIRNESIRLQLTGKTNEAYTRTRNDGLAGKQVEAVMAALQKIDDFATYKSDSLIAGSKIMINSLNRQLILIVLIILLLSLIINYILFKNIRNPINILTDASNRFHDNDLNARSAYDLKNEFGVLSASFNSLAESIQFNMELNEAAAKIAGLMLSEDDARKFFQATLGELSRHTGSQMAAVYLLTDDNCNFEHFESIGLEDIKPSFSADLREGEFGLALSSHKVNYINNIQEDTRFVFKTVIGKLYPREIITIPIISKNNVIAIISLASINLYSSQTRLLIDSIHDTLNARVEGLLAFRKIKEFSERLELQNRELETQKTELIAQSSELSEQNTELEMQKRQLDESSHLKTTFLSNMSHELRTPLNSVIALSSVLNRRLANLIPVEEYSYLEVIERNGKHLLSLINDILDLSRIESGREETEITKFNIGKLISEIINMLKPQAETKNIDLLFRGNELNLEIASDAGKCGHILQNIIGNAIKFTNKGKVEVIADKIDKKLVITIKDSGIGIDEKQLPYIFDEFRQADSSTSRRFGGTGLGLAIAKKYVTMLGGEITVKSESGIGSEFTIELPDEKTAGIAVPESGFRRMSSNTNAFEHKSSLANKAAKTILLVEDSEPAIIQMNDILENDNYSILIAHNGEEALNIITQTIPDAMILDLMMPGIDGFEVLRTLREAEPTAHIPVLILTAKQITKEELGFLKRNNIHQLIQKGDINRAELLSAVASMVFPEIVKQKKQQQDYKITDTKPKVLLVEDNPDNRLTAKAVLSDHFTCIEAVSGEEGVELARKHKPDLVLMDIELPGMNGIETFNAIRSDAALQNIPIIALTASAMTSDRETILSHGFDAYITKPIDETTFFKIINETLHG